MHIISLKSIIINNVAIKITALSVALKICYDILVNVNKQK